MLVGCSIILTILGTISDFFDFYIIPLTKKLKECGVFGVSSVEYLDYAEKNRRDWEQRGQEIEAEYVENVSK